MKRYQGEHGHFGQKDLFGGTVRWQIPCVTGLATLTGSTLPAFPGSASATLRATNVGYLHDPRARPEDGIRFIDIREDHACDSAAVSLCRAHPHALFDRVSPHPADDFEYLLLAPAKPAPPVRAWYLPIHQSNSSPMRTEVLDNHAVRTHVVASLRGALRTESAMFFTDDLHYVLLYLGHIALKLGLTAQVQRITAPRGYVHPVAMVLGKNPALVEQALHEGHAAYSDDAVTFVYPVLLSDPTESAQTPVIGEEFRTKWRFPELLTGTGARLKLFGYEAGGRLPDKPKGGACCVGSLDGAALREAPPFAALSGVPCGIRSVLATREVPGLIVASYRWSENAVPAMSELVIVRHDAVGELTEEVEVVSKVLFVGNPSNTPVASPEHLKYKALQLRARALAKQHAA